MSYDWCAEVIVKCEDGEVLKTGYSSYDDDEDYHHKSFAVSFYEDYSRKDTKR